MAKPKVVYQCSACGGQSPKWGGQCPDCGAWNTLIETAVATPQATAAPARFAGYAGPQSVRSLGEVELREAPRAPTGLGELDRVLGGGLVDGSVVLIGGDPGIGKSTLLLQTLSLLETQPALYVTGEESLQQVGLRAQRLGLNVSALRLLAETCVERVLAAANAENPRVLVIDSIQTLYSEALSSAPGSVGQVRESAAQLVRYAKQTDTAIFIVGHVTKEGALAGPRVLEHMVDTVLYFEGDPGQRYRVMRAVKNRFGAVNELGVFAMTEGGLKPVANPSAIFLSRHPEPVAGSVVMVTREGTRPLLVEVQALVDESRQASPRRVTVGLEQNRLAMLLAVLHRHGGLALFDQDVFVNVVGGVRVGETAADLAVLCAALSSFRDRPIPGDLVIFGEVGLAGEIRPVPNGEERLREAAKHGYAQAIVPQANAPKRPIPGMQVHAVNRLAQALDQLG
ncbi:DNA repair protein RadA [Acidihalobacter aeolianus]|uniref:DNA repair protein RadA n=1 Tax=Acidihalobacter aeolianus TaxID=2792603 RepID=A0A1D8K983_9GAMM|nr:DNA repair protein RadA [Acidihalobacter aeolianus]AOV17507.1 DNA repair protein RadA [Acidihalobacter aeolianus]